MDEISRLAQLPEAVSGMANDIAELKSMMASRLPLIKTSVSPKRELIDIEGAMKITKKARATIYRLVQHGQMPGYKKGKKWYFYQDELEEWIMSGSNRLIPVASFESRFMQANNSRSHRIR